MKQFFNLIALFAFSASLMAQPQQGIEAMNHAFETFLSSKDVLTKSTGWSNGMKEYHFKYTMPDNGQPIHPAALEQLAAAFNLNASNSSALYSYNNDNGKPPFSVVVFSRKDNYFLDISGNYGLDRNDNFRIINFVVDGKLTSFGLIWHEVKFSDRSGKPFRTIDGLCFKFFNGIWAMEKFMPNFAQTSSGQWSIPVSQDESVRYDVLNNQLTVLCKSYVESKKKGEEKTCDAIAYSIYKLCTEYNGILSEQQMQELGGKMAGMFDLTGEQNQFGNERRSTVFLGILQLEELTEKPFRGRTMYTHVVNDENVFVKPDNYRQLWMDFDTGNEQRSQVKVSLTGTTFAKASAVTIKRLYPDKHPYSINAAGGKFTYNGSFDKEQLLEIADQKGNKMIVIADDTPIEIDMLKMTVRGSQQNERFAECQRRLKAMEPELHKYATYTRGSGDYFWTVVDDEGYNRLMNDALQLQMQMMADNKDNTIPVWYLTQNYFQMTADQLAPFMQPDLPYANHLALQPVRHYYEGLQKRAIGKKFYNMAVIDTAEDHQQLSEYIGQGKYAILCFWDMDNRWDMKNLRNLQRTYKDNLNVVCINIDPDSKQWADYVNKRDLRMIHLQPANLGNSQREAWECDIFKIYGITSIPETVIFGPDGRIVANGLCGKSLEAYINQLFHQHH